MQTHDITIRVTTKDDTAGYDAVQSLYRITEMPFIESLEVIGIQAVNGTTRNSLPKNLAKDTAFTMRECDRCGFEKATESKGEIFICIHCLELIEQEKQQAEREAKRVAMIAEAANIIRTLNSNKILFSVDYRESGVTFSLNGNNVHIENVLFNMSNFEIWKYDDEKHTFFGVLTI